MGVIMGFKRHLIDGITTILILQKKFYVRAIRKARGEE